MTDDAFPRSSRAYPQHGQDAADRREPSSDPLMELARRMMPLYYADFGEREEGPVEPPQLVRVDRLGGLGIEDQHGRQRFCPYARNAR